jgi:hypothetical protein
VLAKSHPSPTSFFDAGNPGRIALFHFSEKVHRRMSLTATLQTSTLTALG